jgi:hypothetical protein
MTIPNACDESVHGISSKPSTSAIRWSGRIIPLMLFISGAVFLLAGLSLGAIGGIYMVEDAIMEAETGSGGCMGAEVAALFLVVCGVTAGGLGVVQAIIGAVLFFTLGPPRRG